MPRNLLLIVLDDVGVEKLAPYGLASSYPATPRFDALAANGVRFTRAYGAPICGPTRAALQTGRYAFRTGFGTNVADSDGPRGFRLPDTETFLPEMLRTANYVSGAFGKWHLTWGNGDELHPNRNGYVHFAGCMGNTLGFGNGTGMYDWRRVVDGAASFVTGPPFDTTQWQASVARADAVAWIRAQSRPWFAYVAFNPPHAPYAVPPFELLSTRRRQALERENLAPGHTITNAHPPAQRLLVYDACIEAVDVELGRLIDEATNANTLVLLIGDNGTPGEVIQPPYVPQHAKRSLFEQGIRVPLVAAGAGVARPGRTSDALVHAVDVWRTLANAAGVSLATPGAGRDSVSFLPVLENPAAVGARTRVFTQSFKPNGFGPHLVELFAILDGRYKLLRIGGADQFYEIAVDPRETNDLLAAGLTPEQSDAYSALSEALEQVLNS
ncbi:MAG: sulfatase-like hydrolase/transferase [Planctomycetes bacterium]|nr:sulfatase-like hydrolase/transferase [Planctomycetota bacterium]